ncbi:MAG: amidohydrolase/deacetylase family metallohydrolase [Candidatus Micrarchaeia archaeon]
MYDIVIKNGILIDSSQRISEKMNIAITNGRVTDVGRNINSTSGKKVIDASNEIVVPGFIDFHVHVYYGATPLGIDADSYCLTKGATTVVDAGSSGLHTFLGFKKYIIEQSNTRIYALLSICSIGLTAAKTNVYLIDDRFFNVKESYKLIKENRAHIIGVKWHHSYGLKALLFARELANISNCFLMCENSAYLHYPLENVLKFMKKGDVLTHIFQGGPNPGILDEDGKISSEVIKAVNHGIILDVGHGSKSFSFKIAEKALEEGIKPHIISTDLYNENLNGPVFDLPTTLSKFIALGLDLEEVIETVTTNPAKLIGVESIGNLKPNSFADIVIIRLVNGNFKYVDCYGEIKKANKKIIPRIVIKNGKILFNNL